MNQQIQFRFADERTCPELILKEAAQKGTELDRWEICEANWNKMEIHEIKIHEAISETSAQRSDDFEA